MQSNSFLCGRFFYYYRDIAGAIYPVLEDVQEFENRLELLLQSRIASGGVYREDTDEAQNPFGVSIAYLGLLFAVLASGCQSSDLGSKERELTSQVYGMRQMPQVAVTFANCSVSMLLLSVPPHDQFLVPTNHRSDPNALSDWKCFVLQHEPWNFLRLARHDSSHGVGTRTTR